MITALFAKKLVCEDAEVQVHETFLSHNYPMFLVNYLMWEGVTVIDKERVNFVKVNGEFKRMFGDENGNNQHPADVQEDYNFIVDSLEYEHIRRAVHTTKTLEDIESEEE